MPAQRLSYPVLWLEALRGNWVGICTAYSSVTLLTASQWVTLLSTVLASCAPSTPAGKLSAIKQLNIQLFANFSCSYTAHKYHFVFWSFFAQLGVLHGKDKIWALKQSQVFWCCSEVGTTLAACPYFIENLWVETLLRLSQRNTECPWINSSL